MPWEWMARTLPQRGLGDTPRPWGQEHPPNTWEAALRQTLRSGRRALPRAPPPGPRPQGACAPPGRTSEQREMPTLLRAACGRFSLRYGQWSWVNHGPKTLHGTFQK